MKSVKEFCLKPQYIINLYWHKNSLNLSVSFDSFNCYLKTIKYIKLDEILEVTYQIKNKFFLENILKYFMYDINVKKK